MLMIYCFFPWLAAWSWGFRGIEVRQQPEKLRIAKAL